MLYLIAGHGGNDPGAICGGYTEHNLNTLIAKSIIEYANKNQCTLLDTGINHYTAQTLRTLKTKKDDMVLEIHMDAYDDKKVKGGHVIIWKDFKPDVYDKGLEAMIKDWLPGRSMTMVKRGDLYNCNTCAKRGINYRLVEFGFITNDNDRNFVLNNMDAIGQRVCEIFNIVKTKPEEIDETKTCPEYEKKTENIDKWLIFGELSIHIDKYTTLFEKKK